MLTLIPTAPQTSRAPAPALRRFCEDSAQVDRAVALLQQAQAASDLAERFELAHRAALRAAGVLVARANRERRRPLPLNVWTALRRLGEEGTALAESFAPLVRLRERLARDTDADIPAPLLEKQRELTEQLIARVREQLLKDLEVPPLAG